MAQSCNTPPTSFNNLENPVSPSTFCTHDIFEAELELNDQKHKSHDDVVTSALSGMERTAPLHWELKASNFPPLFTRAKLQPDRYFRLFE